MREKHWTTPRLWKRLKPAARAMRHAPTDAEAALWQSLRSRGVAGLRFRRQHPIGRFIVDFYCSEARLAVEVDGPVHDAQAAEDNARDADLVARGVEVIRAKNDEILHNLEVVLQRIGNAALKRKA